MKGSRRLSAFAFVCSLPIFMVLAAFSLPLFAPQATFTVNTLDDIDDGTCNGTHCSLREAIDAANANGPTADTINFSVNGIIELGSELPQLSSGNITLDGTGQAITLTKQVAAGSFSGILISSAGNTVDSLAVTGMTGTAANGSGVRLRTTSAVNNTILNCNLTGNQNDGVFLDGTMSLNTIGPNNMITNNTDHGIQINNGDNNIIYANTISDNGENGVRLQSAASGNTIGGTGGSEGNLTSGNQGSQPGNDGGISIGGVNSDLNIIQNNTIQNNSAHGIILVGGPNFPTIGGSADNAPNVIRNNSMDGVSVQGSGTDDNEISRNSISGNTDQGIDLSDNGVTANDADDNDGGPNQIQNWPVISPAIQGGDLIITYTVDTATTNAAYPLTIEFFIAESAISNQGETYLGEDLYTILEAQLPKVVNLGSAAGLGLTAGDRIVATATDSTGNTSEFTELPAAPTAVTLLWLAGRSSSSSPAGLIVVLASGFLAALGLILGGPWGHYRRS